MTRAYNIRLRTAVTLTEIIFATVIMALAILPISSLIAFGAKITNKDYRLIEATQILERTGNSLFQEPFLDIPVGSYESYSTPTVVLGMIKGKHADYKVKVVCSIIDVNFKANMVLVQNSGFTESAPRNSDFESSAKTLSYEDLVKQITVEVTWSEPEGAVKKINIVTYRADL
ncbi:MAG: hypothetical protein HQM10_13165 [Candidatus Riflebacteria bacterium]|nr:hypothetical protein [Candidatus Riflebacteria bacterium]